MAERAWEADDALQLFEGEIFVADRGSGDRQIVNRPISSITSFCA